MKQLDSSLDGFFGFIADYRALIGRHIPGSFRMEYDSNVYMVPVYHHLRRVLALTPAGGKVLDLGCGRGHYGAYLSAQGLDCLGIEVREPKLWDDLMFSQDPGVREHYESLWAESTQLYGAKYQYFDGKNLEFPEGSYDSVLFYAAYEHIPVENIAAMTAGAYRMLKPGGRAFIFRCPNQWAWPEHVTRLLGMPHHEKLYGKREILGLLRGAGFEIESFNRSDFFPAHVPPVQGLLNRGVHGLLALEKLVMMTPLRLFAHHFEIVVRKPL